MPPDLAERCIKAGSSEPGECPHCGTPWARVVDVEQVARMTRRRVPKKPRHEERGRVRIDMICGGGGYGVRAAAPERGWAPTCDCPEHAPVPQTILDPFAGASTTLLAADRLQRHGLGIELNPEYVALGTARVIDDCPLFAAAGE